MKKMILIGIIAISSLNANWDIEIKINPIDDTNIVTLKLDAKNNKDGSVWLKCDSEKKVSVSLLNTDVFSRGSIFSQPKIITRFGKEKAQTALRTDSLHYNDPKKFIQKLLDNKTNKFVFKEGNAEAFVFDTTGLQKAIKPLKEACKW